MLLSEFHEPVIAFDTDLFLEKIIDEYGVDNVRIVLLEGNFTDDKIDDMSDEYNDFCIIKFHLFWIRYQK